jgi:hypothetical protein
MASRIENSIEEGHVLPRQDLPPRSLGKQQLGGAVRITLTLYKTISSEWALARNEPPVPAREPKLYRTGYQRIV